MSKDLEQLLAAYLDESPEATTLVELAERVRNSPEDRARFQQEMRLAALSHEVARERMAAAAHQEDGSPLDAPVKVRADSPRLVRLAFGRRATLAALAACLALILGLAALLMTGSQRIARFTEVSGEVTVVRNGLPLPAMLASSVRDGDEIVTHRGGSTRIQWLDEATEFTLEPGTRFRMVTGKTGKSLELLQGRVEVLAAPQPPGKPLIVNTPRVWVQVLGTRFFLATRNDQDWLGVTEGYVKVVRPVDTGSAVVQAGEYAVISADLPIRKNALTANRALAQPLAIDFSKPRREGDSEWEWRGATFEQKKISPEPLVESALGTSRSPVGVLEFPLNHQDSLEIEATATMHGSILQIPSASGDSYSFGFRFRYGNTLFQARYGYRRQQKSHLVLDADLIQHAEAPVKMASASADTPSLDPGAPLCLRLQALRKSPTEIRVRMKAWPAAGPEPPEWILDTGVPSALPLDHVGLQATSAAVVFENWKVSAIERY